MRPVVRRVKAKFLDPAPENSGVLSRPQVRRVVNATRKHEVVGLQSRVLDPLLYGVAGRRRDLKLNGTLGLVLHHYRSRGHLVAVANVPDLEADEVTASKLAVDSKVEKSKFTDSVVHLETDSECPDVLELEWRLLADDLALVPWLATDGVGYGSHDGLPSS
jgi:hypothetical protein